MTSIPIDATDQWLVGIGITLLGLMLAAVWYIVGGAVKQVQATMDRHLTDEAGALQSMNRLADRIEQSNVALRERMTRIEARQEALPSSTSVNSLVVENARLGGEIKALNETLEGLGKLVSRLETTVQRQENYLLMGRTPS